MNLEKYKDKFDTNYDYCIFTRIVEEEFVSKDKIKERIELIDKLTEEKDFNYAAYRYCKNMLEELL